VPRFRRPRSPVHLARQVAAAALLVVALVLSLRPVETPGADRSAPATSVVVAVADLRAGSTLGPGDLAVVRMPPGLVPDGSVDSVDALTGRVLAAPLRTGEPVTDVRVVGAGLTAHLPAGQVAAPVRLADLAVAALVRTGDRIDVLATPDGGTVAVVVAADALVLAAADPRAPPDDDPSAGLLLVAVDGDTAARLAAAATSSTLTVTLPPP
jgi:Flp pilus assembly protein CpaB